MTGEGVTGEEVDRLLDVITLDRIEQSSQDTTFGKLSSLAIAERSPADCPGTKAETDSSRASRRGLNADCERRSGEHPGSQWSQHHGVLST